MNFQDIQLKDIHFYLSEKFSNYIFIDKNHRYINISNKTQGVSTTTRIAQFTKPFDAYNISLAMCKGNAIEAFKLRNEWKAKALRGTTRGTFLHYFMECLLQRKIINIDKNVRKLEPNIDKYIGVCRDYYLNYYQSKTKDINIQSEIVISNGKLYGQIDNLSYRPNVGYIIKDWKFDLEFTTESKYKFEGDLSHLDTSKINKYSLQTKLYERMLGIEIAAIELTHITPEGYNIYNPKDFIEEIDILLNPNSNTFVLQDQFEISKKAPEFANTTLKNRVNSLL